MQVQKRENIFNKARNCNGTGTLIANCNLSTGGRFAASDGLFAGGPFAGGPIAGGPFAGGLNAALALHSEMAKKNDGQRRTVDRLEGAPDVRFHPRYYLIEASLHCHTAQHSRISLCTLTPTINSLKPAMSTVARGI